MLPSSVTAVHPSSSTRTSGLPMFTIGSMAITMPGLQLHAPARFSEVRHLRIFVHVNPDAMSHKIPNHRKPFGFHHALYGSANIAQRRSRLYRSDSCFQRRFGHPQQTLRFGDQSLPQGR